MRYTDVLTEQLRTTVRIEIVRSSHYPSGPQASDDNRMSPTNLFPNLSFQPNYNCAPSTLHCQTSDRIGPVHTAANERIQ